MQRIVPHLWYDKEAREAAEFYISLFDQSRLINVKVIEDTPSGDAEIVMFQLAGQQFEAISAGPYFKFNPSISLMVACSSIDEVNAADFSFNEAFSLIVNCDDQKEIDYFWDKLSAVPEAEQCGWIKDKFGVSWQIVPSHMDEILFNGTKDEIRRVTEAFLKMKKFDINALEQARSGSTS